MKKSLFLLFSLLATGLQAQQVTTDLSPNGIFDHVYDMYTNWKI